MVKTEPQIHTAVWHWLDIVAVASISLVLIPIGWAGWILVTGIDIENALSLPPGQMLLLNAGLILIQSVVFLATVAFVGKMRRINWTAVGLRPMTTRWWLASILIGGGAIPVVSVLAEAVVYFSGEEFVNPQFDFVAPAGFSWPAFLSMAVLVGLVVPLGEELIFRGVLHHWLRNNLNFWAAGAISSLLFGLVHVEIPLVVGTFMLGFIAAWGYEKSGSLWSAFVIHALNNLFSIVAIYFYF